MPTTALVSFFQELQPQMPSAVRPTERWNALRAVSVLLPKMPSSVRVEYPSAFYLIYFLLLTGKQRKQAVSINFLRFDCFYGIPCLC